MIQIHTIRYSDVMTWSPFHALADTQGEPFGAITDGGAARRGRPLLFFITLSVIMEVTCGQAGLLLSTLYCYCLYLHHWPRYTFCTTCRLIYLHMRCTFWIFLCCAHFLVSPPILVFIHMTALYTLYHQLHLNMVLWFLLPLYRCSLSLLSTKRPSLDTSLHLLHHYHTGALHSIIFFTQTPWKPRLELPLPPYEGPNFLWILCLGIRPAHCVASSAPETDGLPQRLLSIVPCK